MQRCLLLLRHVSVVFRECIRNNEAGLGRKSVIITVLMCSHIVDGTGVEWVSMCFAILSVSENSVQQCKNRQFCSSYMYLNSDSLRTRTSLICSIRHNSPSMAWTVIVESAIEMTSSAAAAKKQTKTKKTTHTQRETMCINTSNKIK